MKIQEIKPIINNHNHNHEDNDNDSDDEFKDTIQQMNDIEKSLHKLSSNPDSEEEDNITDTQLISQLKENISKNSIAIADLNLSSSMNSQKTESEPTTPKTNDNNKKKKKKKHLFPKYVYANIFNEKIDDNDEWTDIKRYRFQKCLWKLKYNRIVSTFYLSNLKKREQKWSWMIIVISTLTSGLTVANNVENEPFKNYNTYINFTLNISSMTTSLIAAWIKKQGFIEKINETDKYLLNINSLCEELEIQFSLLNNDRTSYPDFKKKYIPEITKFLTTTPMIPPADWKACIREITLKYPELVDPDNTEDNKLWPWYGDLVFDTDDDFNESHVRHPTTFMKHFKKTNTDKLRSTCCGKKTIMNIY